MFIESETERTICTCILRIELLDRSWGCVFQNKHIATSSPEILGINNGNPYGNVCIRQDATAFESRTTAALTKFFV